jgi:antitoxin component YwqK of YwqJK toxin-antitoxin module
MRLSIIFLLFVCCLDNLVCFAQKGDTLFNQTDKQGKKQGYWKVKYEGGGIKYSAFFKDDKPVGLMKRYFEDHTIKAELLFEANGVKARAKLYYQAGPVAAEGNYINSLKDSTWNYYSYYTKTLSNRETYIKDKKNGVSISYYPNGKVADELTWKDGIRNGTWLQYYENGTLKMSSGFLNGKRTGAFVLNYPNGLPEWRGIYKDDKREGTWLHYDPSGKNDSTIEYKNGVAANADELDTKEQELLKQIEKNKGVIPEPTENNIMNPTRQ